MRGWVSKVFLPEPLHLKYAKINVCDTSRLSRSGLFQQCCIFAHCVSKRPSRQIRNDAKTRKRCVCPTLRLSHFSFLTSPCLPSNVLRLLSPVACLTSPVPHLLSCLLSPIFPAVGSVDLIEKFGRFSVLFARPRLVPTLYLHPVPNLGHPLT